MAASGTRVRRRRTSRSDAPVRRCSSSARASPSGLRSPCSTRLWPSGFLPPCMTNSPKRFGRLRSGTRRRYVRSIGGGRRYLERKRIRSEEAPLADQVAGAPAQFGGRSGLGLLCHFGDRVGAQVLQEQLGRGEDGRRSRIRGRGGRGEGG